MNLEDMNKYSTLEKKKLLLKVEEQLMAMKENIEATKLSFLMNKNVLVKAGVDISTLDFDEWDKQFYGDLIK